MFNKYAYIVNYFVYHRLVFIGYSCCYETLRAEVLIFENGFNTD